MSKSTLFHQALRHRGAGRRACLALILTAAMATGIVGASLSVTTVAQATERVVRLHSSSRGTTVRIAKGKSRTIRTDQSFTDIVVGDQAIANVVPLTDQSFYITGTKIGTTSVALFDEQKRLVGVIEAEISYDTSKLAGALRRQLPGTRIKVSSVNGRIMLSGTAPDSVSLNKALEIAEQFGSGVINSISISRSQQVLLEVRFIEASRIAGRELGVRWEVLGNRFGAIIGSAGLVSGSTPFGTIVGQLLSGGVDADVIVKALEKRGLARRLAEPNLIAMSGDTASFLAGGEFPFPVQADNDKITIEFKRYGVGLKFTPTVLSDGLINLIIEPEVSQLDPTVTVKAGNVEVPSLIVRRASTTVELRDGQSFVMAGLLQASSTTAREQLPWIGQVPVLGALFRSASYRKQETDLAIIVTPRLVKPIAPGEMAKTPLDGSKPANDVDFFLIGKDEVKTASLEKDAGKPKTHGHIIDFPKATRRVPHVDAR